MSLEPGSAFWSEPTVGVPAGIPDEPPRPRTTASTTAITTIATIPPPIASARGDAWRGRAPTPFERTGGGVLTATAAAARRCCLLFLPLGISSQGSRLGRAPGSRQDQEFDEKHEPGQCERRDRHVAELVDPLRRAAAGRRHEARRRLPDDLVLDEQVVDRDAAADHR